MYKKPTAESRINFKGIVDVTPLCLNIWDIDMKNILCNKKAVELFDLENENQYLTEFFKLSPEYQPDGNLSTQSAANKISNAWKSGFEKFNWLHCKLSGEEIPSEITLIKTASDSGEEFIVGFTRDLRPELMGNITDDVYGSYFRRITDNLLLKRFAELTDEWFFTYDVKTGTIQQYGNSLLTAFTSETGDSIGFNMPLEQGYIHEDDEVLYQKLMKNIKIGHYEPLDIRYKLADEEYKYFRLVYEAAFDKDKNPTLILGKGVDVTDQKEFETKSKLDLLTGCYNKITAENLISEKLLTEKDSIHAYIIIDIDNFKGINDNLGHFFGDEVLKEVSSKLKGYFRKNDIIARVGGDEFVVFVEKAIDNDMLIKKAELIVDAFNNTYSGEIKDFVISGSVGIARYPVDGKTYEELYKCADKALYKAKVLGKNQYVIYDDSLELGTMTNKTKLENAYTIASSFFDHDLITSVFEMLYENNGSDESINLALKYICQKYKADRAYIFESFDSGVIFKNTYEWSKNGVSCGIKDLDNYPTSLLGKLFSELINSSHSGIVYSNDLKYSFTSEELYNIMAVQNIKAFLHAQVKKDNVTNFFLGIDDCTKTRVWNEKEINSLRYLSSFISIIIQGKHLQKLALDNEENLKKELVKENTLLKCIETLQSEDSPKSSISKLLKIIAETYSSERSYLYQVTDDGQFMENTYEWYAKEIDVQKELFKVIPVDVYKSWFEKHGTDKEIYIDNFNIELNTDTVDKAFIKSGVKSIAISALTDKGGKLIGFIGVRDPNIKNADLNLLNSISKFVVNALKVEKMANLLEELQRKK